MLFILSSGQHQMIISLSRSLSFSVNEPLNGPMVSGDNQWKHRMLQILGMSVNRTLKREKR